MMEKSWYCSKKFWAMIIAILLAVIKYFCPNCPFEAIEKVLWVIVIYILGQSCVDATVRHATLKYKNANRSS